MTFKELVDSKGLEAHEVAEICHCALSTAYNWLSGKITPKPVYFKLIEQCPTK